MRVSPTTHRNVNLGALRTIHQPPYCIVMMAYRPELHKLLGQMRKNDVLVV